MNIMYLLPLFSMHIIFEIPDVQIQSYANANNETVLTFVPSHRHPWSPTLENTESEHFTFQPEVHNDLRKRF